MVFAKKVAKAIEKAVPCKRIGVAVIGLEVPHAHIHLIPITQEGDMADIEIVSQPEQKAFGQQVVSLLKTCPKWAPARLADGTATNMRYTLPVKFKTPQ